MLRFLLNIIWLVTGGIWLSLSYLLFGLLACIFIITIPIGVASFRMASYALWPFGRTVVETPRSGAVSAVANVIWFVVAGLGIAVTHITTAAAQAATIIGIPLAIANIKMLPVTMFPFGKKIVDARSVQPGSQPLLSI
ncbi:YccF domain-containing protein [Granulicoccus sp. GXG6511]|uniref:YccF domain-containing protein n=1 Tax=Granulicoccus sp. GXG6511 TaxID=3381351 RepID=UPI003D7D3738